MRLSQPSFLCCIFLSLFILFNSCVSTPKSRLASKVLNFDWSSKSFPKALFSGPCITRQAKRNFKLLFVLGLLSIETFEELYVRMPQQVIYGSTPRQLSTDEFLAGEDENLVIIFPGAGGPDLFTEQLKDSILYEDRKAGVKRKVLVYDWSSWRGPFIRAAFDGQLVGKTVGEQLAVQDVKYKKKHCKSNANSDEFLDMETKDRKPIQVANKIKGLKNVDFIGISVGSFAADSAAKWFHRDAIESFENEGLPPVYTKLTLLDPFTSKGIFGYHWGIKNFGMTLDSSKFLNFQFVNNPATNYFEVYINTDDPVPSTSDPILNANNFDITNDESKKYFVPPKGESMHSWPVVYLARNWLTSLDDDNALQITSRTLNPRGLVEKF